MCTKFWRHKIRILFQLMYCLGVKSKQNTKFLFQRMKNNSLTLHQLILQRKEYYFFQYFAQTICNILHVKIICKILEHLNNTYVLSPLQVLRLRLKKSPKKTKSVSSTSLLHIIQFSLTTFKACTIGIQVNYGDLKQTDSDISPAKMGLCRDQ